MDPKSKSSTLKSALNLDLLPAAHSTVLQAWKKYLWTYTLVFIYLLKVRNNNPKVVFQLLSKCEFLHLQGHPYLTMITGE